MFAARDQAIKRLKKRNPLHEDAHLLAKLVAYGSTNAHSCLEKSAKISFVKVRLLETDDKGSMHGDTIAKAMKQDELQGLVPFFYSANLGTTGTCSFDPLDEIGRALKRFPNVWMHVDASYAGNAFICPELRPLMKGVEYADSFNINPNKMLQINYDCSVLWLRDHSRLSAAMSVRFTS